MNQLIEAKVERIPEAGCWLWTGYVTPKGYGQIRRNGRTKLVHRAAYEEVKGPIPEGMHLLHRCDVPCCVNPDHLVPGTNTENIEDSMRKGRRKGITRKRPTGLIYTRRSSTAYDSLRKLTPQQRIDVIDAYIAGEYQYEIAARYGVAQSTIGRVIANGKPK